MGPLVDCGGRATKKTCRRLKIWCIMTKFDTTLADPWDFDLRNVGADP